MNIEINFFVKSQEKKGSLTCFSLFIWCKWRCQLSTFVENEIENVSQAWIKVKDFHQKISNQIHFWVFTTFHKELKDVIIEIGICVTCKYSEFVEFLEIISKVSLTFYERRYRLKWRKWRHLCLLHATYFQYSRNLSTKSTCILPHSNHRILTRGTINL